MIIYLELIAFFSFFPRFSRQASSWFNELEVGLYSRSYFAVLGSRREENGLRRRQLQLKFVVLMLWFITSLSQWPSPRFFGFTSHGYMRGLHRKISLVKYLATLSVDVVFMKLVICHVYKLIIDLSNLSVGVKGFYSLCNRSYRKTNY